MSIFRFVVHKLPFSIGKERTINNSHYVFKRLLNYTSIEYDETLDPSPLFFNSEVQALLKTLTRVDLIRVFRRRKLGNKRLEDPEYRFMTDQQLQDSLREAQEKSEELLQIPPIVPVYKPKNKTISKDPALEGLESSTMVFTDITFGIRDRDRLIVVREPDGTLKEAEWNIRHRINQLYFPKPGRSIKTPRMFQENYLEDLLKRKEYEFILDRACIQFEPEDPDYQRVVSITYQYINDNNGFEVLRSTRHFGALTFFLVWHKTIDNLMLELIETLHVDEASKLLELYEKIHKVTFEKKSELDNIRDYIKRFSNKKGALELGLQAYKDLTSQQKQLEENIKVAHGFS